MSRSLFVATGFLLLFGGCGGVMDEHSGGDHVRGKAQEVQLNDTHDDHISADDGDHTDWKKLTLDSPTMLDVHVYWDNPSIKATIFVKDQFGGNIFELKHETGQPEDHFRNMKMRDGDFYLEVIARRGKSVYTIELVTREGGGGSSAPDPGTRPPE